MSKSVTTLLTVIIIALASVFLSCGVNEPDRYLRPPVIKTYSPGSSSLQVEVGDVLDFSIAAIDPDQQDLHYYFVLGDSIVTRSSDWTYVVDDTGDVEVQGRVSDGVAESAIRWHLERERPMNYPPVINSVVPPEADVTIIVGMSIKFTIGAIDPEGQPLSYFYTIGDSVVGLNRHYTHIGMAVGLLDVRAVVTDGRSFPSRTWTLRVVAEPDSIPPAKVPIVLLERGPEAGELNIEWVAVGDDSMEGLPSYYAVKTSTMPITNEDMWSTASNLSGEPGPAEPGEIQRMVIRDLHPVQIVYVAVRAVDDFGNISALSDLISGRTRGMSISGTVRDAVTTDPIPGVRVSLVRSVDTTAADGTFVLAELPAGYDRIIVQDEDNHAEYGDYFDIIMTPYQIQDKGVVDFWMLPNIELEADRFTNFLEFYHVMTELATFGENLLGRWEPPCYVHVPPFFKNNLDYGETVKEIFREWETAIGIDIFEFVEAVPDTGVYVVFSEEIHERERFTIMLRDELSLPILGRITFRDAYSDTTVSVFQVVVRHEIGHALRMNHSNDVKHIMIGGRFPAVTHPSVDEIKLGKAMYRIPRGYPAAWFRYD